MTNYWQYTSNHFSTCRSASVRTSENNPKRVFHTSVSNLTLIFGIYLILCQILETGSAGGQMGLFGGSPYDEDGEYDGMNSHYTLSRPKRSDALSAINDAKKLIPANYSIHEPPPTVNGSATNVDFYVLIVDIRDVNEVKEELSLELNLQMYWRDTRLSHLTDQSGPKSFVVLNPVLLQHLWHPDVYIDHIIKVEQPNFISPPMSLRIYPDSTIRYSARLTVLLACQMDFHFYPADTQKCNVDMKSYAYMNRVLKLDWIEGKEPAIKKKLVIPNFEVALGNTQNLNVFTNSGVYSSIRFTVILRRYISFHLIQTYLPSALFVIVSFLSFLVAPESIPGRMTLCMTTLLTLTAMFASVKQATPNVSYVKGLDVWMVTCIFFVFSVLLEYTILLKLRYLKPKESKKEKRNKQKEKDDDILSNGQIRPGMIEPSTGIFIPNLLTARKENGISTITVNGSSNGTVLSNISTNEQTPTTFPRAPQPKDTLVRKKQRDHISIRMEYWFSRIIPGLFVLFNMIYWPWLVVSADYYNEHEFRDTNYAE